MLVIPTTKVNKNSSIKKLIKFHTFKKHSVKKKNTFKKHKNFIFFVIIFILIHMYIMYHSPYNTIF